MDRFSPRLFVVALAALFSLTSTVAVAQPRIELLERRLADRPLVIDVTYQQTWCFIDAQTTVAGNRIDILAREACGCLGTPNPTTFQTEVGPLPVGRYSISLSRQGFGQGGFGCEEAEPVIAVDTTVFTSTGIGAIATDPPAPTVDDEVSLVVSVNCNTGVSLETVVDRVVWLRSSFLSGSSQACPPVVDPPAIIPLGKLSAGAHTVIVREDEDAAFLGLGGFAVADLGTPAVVLAERFQVEVTWTRPDGSSDAGRGRLIRDSDRGAEFWFFRPSNPELLVKLLDGCNNNGHRWFFAGGLTNLGVEITVTDRVTDEVVVYQNPLGDRFEPIQDTRAFVCQ
jgi:hypothetical protein